MSIKKTKLLVAELRVIADSINSEYCRKVLSDSASRLEDTDKIAEFYRKQASKNRRKEKCKNIYQKK